MRHRLARLRADRRGISSVAFAGSILAVFGAVAMATDVGVWYAARRGAQNAADAGATAAVMALSLSGPNAGRAAGLDIAGRNGFPNTVGGRTTVAVNIPPSTGALTADPTAVEVVVRQQQTMTAAALFLDAAPTVEARTVGRLRESSNVCILALTGQLWAGGNTTVNTPDCVMASNRRFPPSIEIAGGSLDITAFSLSAVSSCLNCDSSQVRLTQRYREFQAPTEDPFRHLLSKTLPRPSGNCQNFNENSDPDPLPYELNGQRLYCNMHVTGGRAVQLSPGTYYIWEGDFRIGGGSSVTCPTCTAGQGVAVVLTGDPGEIGDFTINSNSYVNLRAAREARDPDYNGVLFYRDVRGGYGSTSSPSVTLNGGTNMSLVGGLYFPSTHVRVNGNAAVIACSVVVAASIDFIGNAEVNGCGETGTRVPRTRQVMVAE
ncbi:pilus assembly protein TadG-related protein [Falsiroseomonas sp.]|uniref:pilus assembly protein TadG-related protein n=1 Tax=Falsiroseomonas sp. TaxID=2870721 RepID=UPI0035681E7C